LRRGEKKILRGEEGGGKRREGGDLEGGLPAACGDGGVEGLEDGAGPEVCGLLPRGRGLAGDARDGGLGAEDAGEGVRLLVLGLADAGGRGRRRFPPLTPAAGAASGSRHDRRTAGAGSRGRRAGGRERRLQVHHGASLTCANETAIRVGRRHDAKFSRTVDLLDAGEMCAVRSKLYAQNVNSPYLFGLGIKYSNLILQRPCSVPKFYVFG